MVGSERGEVDSAIAESRGEASDSVPIKAGRSAHGVTISLGASGGKGRVMLVGYDRRHTTQVGRGENSGQSLVESNIVRSLKTVGAYDGAAIQLSASAGAGEAAAVVIQSYDGRIIGAARL